METTNKGATFSAAGPVETRCEKGLFETLLNLVKALGGVASGKERAKLFGFDILDVNGKRARVTVSIIHEDIDVGPPIEVLERR